MKAQKFIFATIVAVVTALTLPAKLAAQDEQGHRNHVRYTVIDLGTLGGTFSQAFGINNKGSVVGNATLPGDTALHAFLWRKEVMTEPGTIAGADTMLNSAAFSINNNDEVVGIAETSTPDPNGEDSCSFVTQLVCLPVLWQGGVINPLPTLGGPDGQASAINDRGQVVGTAQSGETDPMCQNPVLKPTVWERGQARALPTAPFRDGIVGGAPGPAGNNDKEQVVGLATTCDGSSSRTLLWEKHKAIDMGTIGGLSLVPIAINNKGQAVGTYTTIDGINHAFVWQNGVATDLGTLPGDVLAEGGAINNRGQIVGQSCSTTSCTVFLWQDGVMTDLNAVVPVESSLFPFEASGINSVGEIVGLAFDKNTGACCHGFIAIPNNSAVAESTIATGQGEVSQRPQIVIPQNIRKILERQLSHRNHIRGLVTPKD